MIRRATAVLAAVLAAVLVLAGCSSGDDGSPAPETTAPTSESTAPPVGPQYVALGDSYSAAPGVPETSGADGCFRSSGNYAQLVAAATGLTVTDVTCSGASTDDVLANQVPAITPEAELVTVSIGGNDFDLFTRLIGGCIDLAESDPGGAPCQAANADLVGGALEGIKTNVGAVLDAVTAAAPDAQVIVVGYPLLLPETGTCPELVPLAAGDYPFVNEVTVGLSDALQGAADERGLAFLDVGGPSQGHDICSAEPWVNGAAVAADGTVPFHPFDVEQQAIAEKIAAFL